MKRKHKLTTKEATMNLKELKESGLIKSPAGVEILEEVCDLELNKPTMYAIHGIFKYLGYEDYVTFEEFKLMTPSIGLTVEERTHVHY